LNTDQKTSGNKPRKEGSGTDESSKRKFRMGWQMDLAFKSTQWATPEEKGKSRGKAPSTTRRNR